MAERRVSATEARVHFGELLDSVVRRNDVVFVERAGVPQVVVVSVDEWRRHSAQASDPWDAAAAEMEAHWAQLDEDGADRVEVILQLAREDRDARPF